MSDNEADAARPGISEESMSDEESEKLVALMTHYTNYSLMEKAQVAEPRRTEMKEAFHNFARPPTIREVKQYYMKKIDYHE